VIRVALLGAGYIQDAHARAVSAHPNGELVAIASWREPSARALAARYGIPRVSTDWNEIVSASDVDAAVVATPNALHAPQTLALLRSGKHVMVEKPMAMSVAECDEMIEASRDSGTFVMVAHCWRFREEVRAMRDRIEARELGEVVKTRGYGVHAKWGPSGWFVDPELAGGGALVDMGVHAIDTARFLLGDPLPSRVCATVGTRYGDYAVDDDGILLISWSSGVNSVVESGWWHPHSGGLEADTEVFGTKGYARIWDPEPPSGDYKHDSQPMYTTQMAEFLDAIAEGRQPRPTGEDGRIVMQVVEEAYRSANGSAG
jgi:predicted dehydrogenase